MKLKTLLSIAFYWSYGMVTLLAQTDSLIIDSIRLQQTIHHNYRYQNGERQLAFVQTIKYDTNGIIIHKKRAHYKKEQLTSRYLLEYNPQTLRGFHQTEQLKANGTSASVQKTTFKNYNRTSNKRYWVKTQKPNSTELLRQVHYKYDKNGGLIEKEATNYATVPPSSTIEKVTRNAAGNMLTWFSYDKDGTNSTQARSFSASYLDDSLLLRSSNLLYYTYTTVANSYNRKRQRTKTIQRVGSRSTKGKVKYTNETKTIYKNGKPYQLTEKNFRKKVRTITYTYLDKIEIQQVVTPEKSYEERITTTFHEQFPQLLSQRTTTKEGHPFLTETWDYTPTGLLESTTTIEKRKNGKDWTEKKHYNTHGELTARYFFINDELKIEEIYKHQYE